MINYLPERIYALVKDDKDYKEVVKIISDAKATCSTLQQFVESDSDEFIGVADSNKYHAQIESVINKYCPQYMVQYHICNGEYTKEEMLEMYNSDEYDNEIKLYLLSNIINKSYIDASYDPYIELYVEKYETIPEAELLTISEYCHLKYLYAKIHMISLDYDSSGDVWVDDLFKKVQDIYDKALALSKNDTDICNNYMLEALAHSIQLMSYKANIYALYRYICKVYDYASLLKFQYKNYSFGILKIMDLKNVCLINMRNYAGFINQTIIIMDYISNTLKNMDKLFNGLNYYDKCNHGMFAVLIRKYIKVKNGIPCITKNSNAVINNLTDIDKQYILSNIIIEGTPSEENNICVAKYRMDTDKWFSPNNMAFNLLKAINVEGD